MAISILYRDDFFLICEKPAGISSESPGLPDLVAEQTGLKSYPVHRLDQGTGGVIILALSPETCSALQDLFLRNLILKEYVAVVSGCPENSGGCFEDLLWHDRRTNKSFVVSRPRCGVRKAKCEWLLLRSVPDGDRQLSLLRVLLHTGRTHQIRVQFSSRGFPLVGDRRYGSRIEADTPALWAVRISFPHPFIKERTVSVSSLPPKVFPWSLFPSGTL